MLLTASIIAMGFGLVSLFDSDFAWSLHEADARLMGTPMERTKDWEIRMMIQGFILFVLGGVGVMVSMGLLQI
jgi:hypothetical protein